MLLGVYKGIRNDNLCLGPRCVLMTFFTPFAPGYITTPYSLITACSVILNLELLAPTLRYDEIKLKKKTNFAGCFVVCTFVRVQFNSYDGGNHSQKG